MSVSPLAYLALTDYFYSYTVGDFRVLLFLEMDTEDGYRLQQFSVHCAQWQPCSV